MYAKFTVASLASAVSATATPGLFPAATYPKFGTIANIAGDDLDTDNVKSTYLMNGSATNTLAGPVRGFRAGHFVFPT